MDKEKATRTLAKELGDKLGKMIVVEDKYKEGLIENASAVYQLDNPLLLEYKYGEFRDGKTCKKNILEVILLQKGSFEEANYCFFKSISSSGDGCTQSNIIITPYALIGEKEEKDFRRLFYKDVHPDIIYAADILGIKNFISLYEKYEESFIPLHKMLEGFDAIRNIIDTAPHLKYDDDNEISIEDFENRFGDISLLNEKLKEMGTKTHIITGTYHSTYIKKSVVLKFIEDLRSEKRITEYMDDGFLNEFIDFIFTLPYEDQNIEANKEILKKATNLEFVTHILSKEYTSSNTHHFQTYFDILSKGVQEKVVKSLGLVSHNSAHDSFLWSQGFKDIEMDYLGLYSEDAGSFIEYFSKKGPGEKKIILEDILKCDHVNQEVIDWLDTNESQLLKEVSFNG